MLDLHYMRQPQKINCIQSLNRDKISAKIKCIFHRTRTNKFNIELSWVLPCLNTFQLVSFIYGNLLFTREFNNIHFASGKRNAKTHIAGIKKSLLILKHLNKSDQLVEIIERIKCDALMYSKLLNRVI